MLGLVRAAVVPSRAGTASVCARFGIRTMTGVRAQFSSSADSVDGDGVAFTERGALRLKEICEASASDEDASQTRLRLSIEGGGCSGFQYKFEMERDPPDSDMDLVFTHEATGMELIVDDVSIDFVREPRSTLSRIYCDELSRSLIIQMRTLHAAAAYHLQQRNR